MSSNFFLHRKGKKDVIKCGAFVCHSDLDPVQECRRILYHSVDFEGGGALDYSYMNQAYKKLGILTDWGRYILSGSKVKDSFSSVGANLEVKGIHVIDYKQAK